jgi:hypothetical protein
MFTVILLSVLAGMVLGQRFKVLALLPAIVVTLLVTIAAGLARAETPWLLALSGILGIVGIQVGYLLGLGVRQLTAGARGARLPAASFGGSIPARRPAR